MLFNGIDAKDTILPGINILVTVSQQSHLGIGNMVTLCFEIVLTVTKDILLMVNDKTSPEVMFVHEFLNRTARRNLNLQIDCKVQQRIKSYVQNLEERRHQLACQLHWEEQQLQLELHELQQARADAAENKRIETIQLSIIQKKKNEKELIEQTRFQREIKNTEDYRHRETKEILLDTKQAQIYQIAERRERRRREAYVDKQWQLS